MDSDRRYHPTHHVDGTTCGLERGGIEEGADAGSRFAESSERATRSRRVNRRIDIALLPFLSTLYLFNGLDRSNVGNAETQGTLCKSPVIESPLADTSLQDSALILVLRRMTSTSPCRSSSLHSYYSSRHQLLLADGLEASTGLVP